MLKFAIGHRLVGTLLLNLQAVLNALCMIVIYDSSIQTSNNFQLENGKLQL